ncbi:MAG TPA: hypothetical protein VGQ95_09010 [Chthoniobacterales bacterium]|nr:hypothetical protein [Chthoniobacterales bacterium]
MADLWGAAKCHIKEMVRRLTELGPFKLRWAAYRDYCDGSDLFQSSDWHDSADPLLRFIDRVSCTGGGDFEEAVEYALKCAVEEPIATRIILIGDAPPHPERDFREQATQLGKLGRPVFAFVVGEHAETQEAFAEIARLSGGKSTALRSANDLLDVVVLTVAHEMGGAEEVQQYLQKYSGQLGQGAREYGQLLLGRGSND